MATKRKAVAMNQAPEGGTTYEYANPHYAKHENSDAPIVINSPRYESFKVGRVFHEQALAAWMRRTTMANPNASFSGVRGFVPDKDGGAIVYKFNDELDHLTKEELETEE